jgi:hypothetical protein
MKFRYGILVLLGVFVSIPSFSQKYINILDIPRDLPIVDGKVTYQGIIEIEGASMAQLHGYAKKFIAETYKSTDAAIDMDDIINGVIVVKGRSDVPLKWVEQHGRWVKDVQIRASTNHILIFDLKDDKFRYSIKEIAQDNQSLYGGSIESHVSLRESYNPSSKYKRRELGRINYSAAYVVGCHEYFQNYSNRLETYFIKQKLEDW